MHLDALDARVREYAHLRAATLRQRVEGRAVRAPASSSPRASWWSSARCASATGCARCCCSRGAPSASAASRPPACRSHGDGRAAARADGFDVHRGVLAAFDARAARRWHARARRAARRRARGRQQPHERRRDIRSASALASTRCCSIRPPATRSTGAALRISMGEALTCPHARHRPAAGRPRAAAGGRLLPRRADAGPGSVDIAEVAAAGHERLALLLGTEGAGLSPRCSPRPTPGCASRSPRRRLARTSPRPRRSRLRAAPSSRRLRAPRASAMQAAPPGPSARS